MKIALTSKGKDLQSEIDARFGRCPYFVIFNTETKETTIIDNLSSSEEAHGAGPKTAQKLSEQNCDILITGNGPGGNAATVLEKMNIKIFVGAANKTIEQAIKEFENGNLKKF